jgi:7-cyano-7-deazaguanine synthase
MTAIVVLSGGMDSTTALHHALALHDTVQAVSVDYGQRHVKELEYATSTCNQLDVRHDIIDASALGLLLAGSALTTASVEVPQGHYADESMRSTVVPNRNAILLNLVAGIAVARKMDAIVTGVHAGDHPIYPDCRPEFITALQHQLDAANEGYHQVRVEAPFVHVGKHDIVRVGDKLGVNWARTWSCYQGDVWHCGKCGTCVERREAFQLAGVTDPTRYAA